MEGCCVTSSILEPFLFDPYKSDAPKLKYIHWERSVQQIHFLDSTESSCFTTERATFCFVLFGSGKPKLCLHSPKVHKIAAAWKAQKGRTILRKMFWKIRTHLRVITSRALIILCSNKFQSASHKPFKAAEGSVTRNGLEQQPKCP
jgi:hypothetical protein